MINALSPDARKTTMLELQIVEVELVEGDFIGVRLSDDTALLISVEEILSLGLPRYTLLASDNVEVRVQ